MKSLEFALEYVAECLDEIAASIKGERIESSKTKVEKSVWRLVMSPVLERTYTPFEAAEDRIETEILR